jgi:multiple sugar transport system substrate-binding protein
MERRRGAARDAETGRGVTRRGFLAGAAAGGAGLAGILASGRAPVFAQTREVKIMSWSHFVPASDAELRRQGEEWGRQNNVRVTLDTVPHLQLAPKKAAEVTAQSGHDIVLLYIADPDLYFDHLADLSDLAEELGKKHGGWYNSEEHKARGTWRSIPWYTVAWPLTYRSDILEKIGEKALDTWEDLYRAGKKAKAIGHPIGIAMSHCDDTNLNMRALMWAHGASYVGKDGKQITLRSPQTVEAIEFMKRIYKDGMEPEVLAWDDSHNNRSFNAGKSFAILNPTSAYESAKAGKIKIPGSDREIHEVTEHALPPRGPVTRATSGTYYVLGIWKFSKNVEAAKDFLRFHFDTQQMNKWIAEAKGYNLPFLQGLSKHPIWASNPKYKFVSEIGKYMHPPGWPGLQTAHSQLVMDLYIIPDMFAQAVTGRLSTNDAIAWAEKEITEIHAGRKRA